MKYTLFFLLLFFMIVKSLAQDMGKIDIIKVLDCNLFLSVDSQIVKMAYVDCPSIHL